MFSKEKTYGWMQRMKMRARMLLDRGRAGDRITAELGSSHRSTDGENIAAGMSAGEARAAALRTFDKSRAGA